MSWLFGKKKTPQGMCGVQACLCTFTGSIALPVSATLSQHRLMMRNVELLRENKRMLDKAIRELDRERMALQNQEKKTILEIKKTAKAGQMVPQHGCSTS